MKNIKKLQQAADILFQKYEQTKDVDGIGMAIMLIHEFIVDNEPVKKGTLSVWDFVIKSKSEAQLRPAMACVFHDAEHKSAVGTDAHVMYANPAEYDEKYAGKVIDKYGKEAEEHIKYPNWSKVIPQDKDLQTLDIREDLQDVRDTCKSTMKLKQDNKNLQCIVCINKELGVWVNLKYAELILQVGADGWKCSKERPKTGAIVKKWEDGKVLLIMPMMGPEDLDYGTVDKNNMVAFIRK